MCIRDRIKVILFDDLSRDALVVFHDVCRFLDVDDTFVPDPVSYTHLRAHETVLDIVCRLLLEQKHERKATSTTHYHHKPRTKT